MAAGFGREEVLQALTVGMRAEMKVRCVEDGRRSPETIRPHSRAVVMGQKQPRPSLGRSKVVVLGAPFGGGMMVSLAVEDVDIPRQVLAVAVEVQ